MNMSPRARTTTAIATLLLTIVVYSGFGGGGRGEAEPMAADPSSRDTSGVRAPQLPILDNPGSPPRGAEAQFTTDFRRSTIPFSDVLSGGPPKDGIPAIDSPTFVSVKDAAAWLQPNEPVMRVVIGDAAKAYPIQVLTWHEIVNDVVANVPVTVTFCPLCNTGIAFERSFDGQVLDFGTTGRLRFSNLIMYDRQTETWWQQATGEGVVGRYAGAQLTFVPAAMVSFEEFQEAHPEGQVLSRDTGYSRSYGSNPYTGYDTEGSRPFLYRGPATPNALPEMARVVTVDVDGESVAYPYTSLQEQGVINDAVAGRPIAVFWQAGTASALDHPTIASGRDVGAGVVFSRVLDGDTLTFEWQDGAIVDSATSSTCNVLGTSTAGALSGKELTEVVSINHFWFSWAAFRPETRVETGS